jgi:hypothetical protein
MTRQDEIIEMAQQAGMMADGDMWFSPSHEYCDVHIAELEAFAKLVEKRKVHEIAKSCGLLPFGDTAHSFAIWIREQAK